MKLESTLVSSLWAISVAIVCLPVVCIAEETPISIFVGPYLVEFNDSYSGNSGEDRSLSIPPYNYISGEWEHRWGAGHTAFFLLITRNNLNIYIEEDRGGAEEDLYNDGIDHGFMLNNDTNSTIAETYQRRIAGYDGKMIMRQNKDGQIFWYGIFRMRAKSSCGDLTDGRLVRIQIKSSDYTREEFDRVLDTFSIEHYVREP
jgi:hypothetical protein